MTETYPEPRNRRLANRPNEKTLLAKRIAGYTLAGLGALALMATGADAAGLINGAKIKPRTITQKQIKPGSLTAKSFKKGALPQWRPWQGWPRWRTGRHRPCGACRSSRSDGSGSGRSADREESARDNDVDR